MKSYITITIVSKTDPGLDELRNMLQEQLDEVSYDHSPRLFVAKVRIGRL